MQIKRIDWMQIKWIEWMKIKWIDENGSFQVWKWIHSFDPRTQIHLILESFRGWINEWGSNELNEWRSHELNGWRSKNWWGWMNEWGSHELNKCRSNELNECRSNELNGSRSNGLMREDSFEGGNEGIHWILIQKFIWSSNRFEGGWMNEKHMNWMDQDHMNWMDEDHMNWISEDQMNEWGSNEFTRVDHFEGGHACIQLILTHSIHVIFIHSIHLIFIHSIHVIFKWMHAFGWSNECMYSKMQKWMKTTQMNACMWKMHACIWRIKCMHAFLILMHSNECMQSFDPPNACMHFPNAFNAFNFQMHLECIQCIWMHWFVCIWMQMHSMHAFSKCIWSSKCMHSFSKCIWKIHALNAFAIKCTQMHAFNAFECIHLCLCTRIDVHKFISSSFT